MIKKMLVNATHPEENRVAIVEDGILSELDIEVAGKEQTKGNIYKATVIRVEQGLQAAFVDYGAERLGFLQMGEIHSSLFPKSGDESKSRPRINEVLHRGQELLVQVTKEERGNKGAALTTFLSLPGRYMVLMPGDKTRGMSRKIPDGAERKQLKESIAQFELPEEMGYIIRTAAIGQTAEELTRDLQYLLRVYNNILELSRKVKSPALIYRESNLMIRSIRDYFTPDMDEVLVDDPAVLKEAQDFFQQVMPEYAKLVKLHQERRPIFSKYQIEDQIETIAQKQVFMPGGGSIVIDSTEALVAIDVNSGKMAGETGVEGTAYKTNLEAASEVARQLRLRDLGGLVVIDFIDMRDRKHIREVEKRLKDALKPDKARVTVGRISQFGLLEMSRQRIKAALAEGSYLSCPNCQGSGRVRSVEAQAVAFLRKVHAAVARGQLEKIEGEVPIAVSHYLLNNKREELVDLERRYQTSISILGRKSFVADQTELTLTKREKDDRKILDAAEPVTAATTLADREESQGSGNGEAADEKPAKKSRNRRRGRKSAKSDQVVETSTINESAAESLPEPVPEVTTSESTAEIGAEPQPTAETTEETAEKRPARRRRGRRSKKPATIEPTGSEALETEAEPTAPAEVATESAPAAPEQTAPVIDGDTPAEAKPARKRRSRRTKKPADSAGTAPDTASNTPDRVPEPTAAPLVEAPAASPPSGAAVATAETTETPRKRRTRRTSKPATVAAETTEAAAQPDKVSTPDSPPAQNEGTQKSATIEEDSPAADKPRRTRRTRKPAASKTADEQAETKAEKVPEPATAEPEAAEVKAKKPAARRRKPAAKKPAPAAEPTSDTPAEEKPKPKRRSRKPATKADEETLQPNEAQD